MINCHRPSGPRTGLRFTNDSLMSWRRALPPMGLYSQYKTLLGCSGCSEQRASNEAVSVEDDLWETCLEAGGWLR